MTKIIFEGSLFAECELLGKNRHGMLRIAEEIAGRLIPDPSFDCAFANSIYMEKYHSAMLQYISSHFPALSDKVISQKPLKIFNVLYYRALFRKYPWLCFPELKFFGLDEYDLYHSFYYPIPEGIQKSSIKKSITFLDLIPLRMAGYSKGVMDLTRNIIKSFRNNTVIAISEFSKNDLLNYDLTLRENDVFAVPLAASRELFYPERDPQIWLAVKAKYELPDRYFLCISSSDIRKNISHLILSFNHFVMQEGIRDIYLVLAGNATHGFKLLDQLRISADVRKQIVIPKRFIEERDLASVYSNASCFFFMSFYEGFGLPVLEAMQCGVPVVASNRSSIPEVAGSAGILLDPDDRDALSEVMLAIYSSPALREKLSNLSLEQAKLFSWERTAREYCSIFRNITNSQ